MTHVATIYTLPRRRRCVISRQVDRPRAQVVSITGEWGLW